jgi:sulfatase maturation enzyme AslB (radical SAM superfamily)
MTSRPGWIPAVLRPAPHYLFIETTSACNLRCRQCHMWMSTEPAGTLTTAEKVALVDEFGQWTDHGVVVLTGGEPFLKPDEVLAVSRAARRHGLSVAVNTNGTLIPPDLFDALLREGPHYLVLSIDAPDAQTHDWLRGRAGTWDTIVETIRGLLEARATRYSGSDVKLLVNGILCAPTLPAAGELFAFTRSLGVDGVMFQALARTFMNQGNGDPFFERHRPQDLALVDRVLDELIALRKTDRFLNTEIRDLEWMKHYFRNPDFISEPVCGSAHRNMMVNMYGEIQLCFAMKALLGGEHLGSIRTTTLRAAWEGAIAAQARTVMDSCRKNCGMLHCHRREGPL